jgi:hypothetical protein
MLMLIHQRFKVSLLANCFVATVRLENSDSSQFLPRKNVTVHLFSFLLSLRALDAKSKTLNVQFQAYNLKLQRSELSPIIKILN